MASFWYRLSMATGDPGKERSPSRPSPGPSSIVTVEDPFLTHGDHGALSSPPLSAEGFVLFFTPGIYWSSDTAQAVRRKPGRGIVGWISLLSTQLVPVPCQDSCLGPGMAFDPFFTRGVDGKPPIRTALYLRPTHGLPPFEVS